MKNFKKLKIRFSRRESVSLMLALGLLGIGLNAAAEENEGFTYNDNGKRDPFWELVGPEGSINNYENDLLLTDLSLQGIMSGSAGNIAMINGKIVRASDKIGQYLVKEITDDWVVLEKGQQVFKLKLKKEE